MRLGVLKYMLSLFVDNNFITGEQRDNIFSFMKERKRRQIFRLVQWVSIIGAFWIVFGVLALIKLLDLSFLKKLYEFVVVVTKPFFALMNELFGQNYLYAVFALIGIISWSLFFWLAVRITKKENLSIFKLSYFQESRLRSATVFFVISYICAGLAFSFLNRLLIPDYLSYYYSTVKIIPIFYMFAVVFFMYFAYRLKDQISLLFGIYFTALSVGTFSGYGTACYYLAVSRPVVQLLVSIIFVLLGFLHLKDEAENWCDYFGRTYQWTGLLMGFIALWIMSIWGISKPEGWVYAPKAYELWIANIMFIAVSTGSMFYGAYREDAMFFNYGLTFLIIATYTIFFSYLWQDFGVAFGSLSLGLLLVLTGYLLKRVGIIKKYIS
ncbi:MAG: hypothetical protein PHP69_05275 [Candidatus Omnitrophica bacterium]|nr:hypothetical protein [Candidatus Omnitrophota bacterium]MDD5081108.1 hypothetical protein [Candidatus Omnitrophota bacterium]MDD5441646.1 hypothetical protein [Candidatus Omnitrophota bacterium]